MSETPGSGLAGGPTCPAPAPATERIRLGHGSGGRLSARLLRDHFLPHLTSPDLARLADATVLPIEGGRIAVTTDTFVVHPLEFPGGDIGSLAIHGTLNDLAMVGARPRYLTAGFILEEGLLLTVLDRIVQSMAGAASRAGVPVVAGDTKVVERGKCDGLYINTTGVGTVDEAFLPGPDRATPADAVIVSGPIGAHGMAIMAARNDLGFETSIRSDSTNLGPLVDSLREAVGSSVHVLRDATRGGVASALNEIAGSSGVGISIDEDALPVENQVRAACEVLGLDPLYVANEGVLVAVVTGSHAEAAVSALRGHGAGAEARVIGSVVADHAGMVAMRTLMGGTRVVDMLPGDQLPRIC